MPSYINVFKENSIATVKLKSMEIYPEKIFNLKQNYIVSHINQQHCIKLQTVKKNQTQKIN